jgi:hypothetical protein
VHGATANAFPAVVSAEGQRMLTARDTNIVPVKIVRALLIAHPIALGIPKGASIKSDHAKARAGQALQKNSATCTHTHDEVIYFLAFGEVVHGCFDPLNRTEHVRFTVWRLKLPE